MSLFFNIFRCHSQRRGLVDERPSRIATRRLRHDVRRPDVRRLQHVRHRDEVIRTSNCSLSLDGVALLKPPRTGNIHNGALSQPINIKIIYLALSIV